VYLLHDSANFAARTLPQLIYVISPKGDVVRKLQIDTGNPELIASSIKFHAGHLALGFHWLNHVPQSLIKIIDLEGNPISEYIVQESADDADPILAFYNPEGFTLVPDGESGSLSITAHFIFDLEIGPTPDHKRNWRFYVSHHTAQSRLRCPGEGERISEDVTARWAWRFWSGSFWPLLC
jgi:hypothetical protein